MTTLELWIRRHHRRLALGLFLQRAGEWLAVWLFLFGAAVLTAKLFLPEFWPDVLWLTLLAVPILVLAAFSASQTPFSRTESVALLDRQLKGGGLIMTLAEADDPAWHNRLPQTPQLWKRKLPKLRPVRFFRRTGWPLAFVLGALLIPTRNPHPTSRFSPAVGQKATRQLENMLGLLEESHVVAPEEAAEMKTVIEQLSEETQHAPLTSEKWETVDALRKTLGEKLQKDEAQIQDVSEKVSTLLKSQGGELDRLLPENQADFNKVAEVVKSLSDRGALPELPESLGPAVEQMLKQGTRKLAEDPKLREQVLSQVQNLLKDRSLDLQKVRSQFEGAFAGMPGLGGEKVSPKSPTEPSDDAGTSTIAGDGGKIRWGDKTENRQEKFKQVVLPPGYVDDPENQVAGSSPDKSASGTARPSENVASKKPTQFESAAGGEVRSRELRPRHRAIVKKYFQKGAEEKRDENP